jgi:hypothetical protein
VCIGSFTVGSFTTTGALAAPVKTSNADTETGPVGLAMFEFMSLF